MTPERRIPLAARLAKMMLTPVNVRLASRAVDMLDVRPDHTVLAVGCGRGEVVQLLAERAWNGEVVGIEPVDRLRAAALDRNRAAIAVGAVELLPGDVTALPWPDASFDRACAINTLYLWPAVEEAIDELGRVLRPGGRLVVAVRARADDGTLTWRSASGRRSVDEIEAALAKSGFDAIERVVDRLGLITNVSIAANAGPHRGYANRQAQSALRQARSQSTSR